MQNNNNQKRGASRKKNAPPKPGKKQASVKTTRSSRGAAQASGALRVGMGDLSGHRLSWITGYTYVGDGTTGATDAVVMQLAGGSSYVNASAGGGSIPVLGADSVLGQSYVSDVEKHFARKRVRSVKLHLVSLQPSTANSMMAYVAPIRGAGASGDTVYGTGTTAGATLPNVLSASGAIPCASWESKSLDLTPYIAGGSGPKQNEFALNRDGDDASTYWGAGSNDLTMEAPCAFVISGSNSTAALRGTRVHMVVIEQIVDLLDFIGGVANPYPFAFSETLEMKEARREFERLLKDTPKLASAYGQVRALEGAAYSTRPRII